ncbi:g2873 [Coccomyxa viridis]|uniref:peptidylprolyl isomerase n=1 Tax=Coccomyxa viridis TaxID=1274662 RepID=A0ABP1FQF8_9CHLO
MVSLSAFPAGLSRPIATKELHSEKATQLCAPKHHRCKKPFRGINTHCSAEPRDAPNRRDLLASTAALCSAALLLREAPAGAADSGANTVTNKLLCDEECLASLESIQTQETKTGLKYKDIVVGKGPSPPTGYQVTAHYVAMTPNGRVFDSSLDRGFPYDIRVGSGQIVAGLDEGIASMKPGGLRRLYIPGNLSFPKGLPSGPGRPRVPPASPVVFDVQLLYIPGLEADDE